MRGGAVVAGLSLRRRLILQLLAVAAVLTAVFYLAVRETADRAAAASQDAILGAAAATVADALRGTDEGVEIDLPAATFSMLGAVGQDRLFWRIAVDNPQAPGGVSTLTGYDDLPLPPDPPPPQAARFWDAAHAGAEVRLVAVARTVVAGERAQRVTVILAQTRFGQEAVAGVLANRAALLGLGFLALAVPLSLLTAGSVLRPLDRLAEAVARRGPRDLRPVRHPAPAELAPLVAALNGFVARLRGA
ncbi:MAG TPA: sensor histidine kinase N-terminal domain-containing protein, partial [Paracoccaceae bacterium]|nr:sensor histidine kinase N-terminal domain-containing protein [Paracoccaceae bacterium]